MRRAVLQPPSGHTRIPPCTPLAPPDRSEVIQSPFLVKAMDPIYIRCGSGTVAPFPAEGHWVPEPPQSFWNLCGYPWGSGEQSNRPRGRPIVVPERGVPRAMRPPFCCGETSTCGPFAVIVPHAGRPGGHVVGWTHGGPSPIAWRSGRSRCRGVSRSSRRTSAACNSQDFGINPPAFRKTPGVGGGGYLVDLNGGIVASVLPV